MSIFSKVYSSVLNTRLSKYLEAVGILNEEQNGFRKGRSCEEHAFLLEFQGIVLIRVGLPLIALIFSMTQCVFRLI